MLSLQLSHRPPAPSLALSHGASQTSERDPRVPPLLPVIFPRLRDSDFLTPQTHPQFALSEAHPTAHLQRQVSKNQKVLRCIFGLIRPRELLCQASCLNYLLKGGWGGVQRKKKGMCVGNEGITHPASCLVYIKQSSLC